MRGQYNFSSQEAPRPRPDGAVLAIDTGSPLVSLALAVDSEIIADRSMEQRQSSGRLLASVDEILAEAGLRIGDIGLFLGLRGPGSFTGLRVGLATLQGLRMALDAATATYSTFEVLASLAPEEASRVVACVDALRGEWLTQEFSLESSWRALAEPTLCKPEEMIRSAVSHCVGFGVARALADTELATTPIAIEPGPLAAQALRLLQEVPPDRDPRLLADPLYLRAPAASPARPSQP